MRFAYVATNPAGQIIRGDVEALTPKEAVRQVRARGLIVTDVQPVVSRPSLMARLRLRFGHVSLLHTSLLARHLALMLRSGITVDRAFELLVGQTRKRVIRTALQGVLEAVRRGEALAAALGRYPHVFPRRFVAMVQWGEAGGSLPESLDHLAIQLEHDRDLQGKVRGAMIYPAIIVGAIIIVGALMSIFVLPQLVEMIESFDVTLPLPTVFFLSVTRFVTQGGVLTIPAAILVLIVLGALLRTGPFRPALHRFFLRVPIIGGIVRAVNLARMDRAFGSLVKSGIPIVEALSITTEVLGNVHYQRALQTVSGDVRKGVSLGKALKGYPALFPAVETDMITVGEETGRLEDVLLYLAEFYETQVNQATKNLAQTVEPLLLLVVGVVVGAVVLAIIMPIYQLAEGIV